MTLPDPANDRDEPTDEEISEHIATHTDCDAEITDMMTMTTDAEILKWARNLRQGILDAIVEKRDNDDEGDEPETCLYCDRIHCGCQKSDGDE